MSVLLLAALLSLPSGAQTLDRAQPAPSGVSRPYVPPPVRESQLKSGVKLALIEVKRLPLVSVQILLPRGADSHDPDGREGLADLVAQLIKDGAGSMPKARYSDAFDKIGATLSVSAATDALIVTVFASRENIGEALTLAAKALRRPRFSQKELDLARLEHLASLTQAKGDPGKLADRRLDVRIFGGHPYGRQTGEASLRAITLADANAYAARLRPEDAAIVAAGALSLEELERLASKAFGDWRARPGAAAPIVAGVAVAPSAAGGLVIDLIDLPGSMQSAIRAGHTSLKSGDPDYYAVSVMNYVLGRADMVSRLNRNLREAHGWAYGASSELLALKDGGSFTIKVDVQTDATAAAVTEILKELGRMRDELVPDDELSRDKTMMLAGFVRNQMKVQAVNAELGHVSLYGLPKDFLATYRDKISAVTAADVQAAARKYIRPDALQIVISGDAAKVRRELETLATVRPFDASGNPVSAPAAPAGR